jgi:hypothetical protein
MRILRDEKRCGGERAVSDYNLCPECSKLWYLVNQKGVFKILSFTPITKDTEHKVCPKCKEAEMYKLEKVRCFQM